LTACVQHRFAASGVEGKTMSFLFIIQQQFRAEKSLLSDSTYNELLIINLATVQAEGILFPHLLQAVKRYLQPILTAYDASKTN
jgi:hypothetical protein